MPQQRPSLLEQSDSSRNTGKVNSFDPMPRRWAAKLMVGAAAGLCLPMGKLSAVAASDSSSMLTRAIPSTGEKLPVIGLGTWQTFDVGTSSSERTPLSQVLSLLVKSGGRIVDSSPMYGRAEEVIGDLADGLQLQQKLFFATKVFTRGRDAGIQSMERSFARLKTNRIDLMQVHNLVDVGTHLQTMREWKAKGRFRYIGVTHYNETAFPELEKVLRSEKVDFVQINYSIGEREADQRILPLTQEKGIAVIINRPFGGGDLFSRVRSKPLPNWAGEFDCHSWAQFLLKWILANPVVTCAIPATNNPEHLQDNVAASFGRLPDDKMRQRMVDIVTSL